VECDNSIKDQIRAGVRKKKKEYFAYCEAFNFIIFCSTH
jgi:hypothetical protein